MNKFQQAYRKLLKSYGEQHWWPTVTVERETEVILGAILTQ